MQFADHFGIKTYTLDNGEKVIEIYAPAEDYTKTFSIRLLENEARYIAHLIDEA